MLSAGDRLPGFLAQTMGGPKVVAVECTQYLLGGSYIFTAPRTGYFKFVAWGAGGAGAVQASTNGGGGSGAYGEATRFLAAGQRVSIVVGSAAPAASGGSTVLTFPDGSICTAAGGQLTMVGGQGGPGGSASGFDINLAGSQGGGGVGPYTPGAAGAGTSGGAGGAVSGSWSGGGGAPANLPYIGAAGAPGNLTSTTYFARGPGAGGGSGAVTAVCVGGEGAVIVQYLKGQ